MTAETTRCATITMDKRTVSLHSLSTFLRGQATSMENARLHPFIGFPTADTLPGTSGIRDDEPKRHGLVPGQTPGEKRYPIRKLPAEIRNRIYALCLGNESEADFTPMSLVKRSGDSTTTVHHALPNLLLLGKWIRKEATEMFWEGAAWRDCLDLSLQAGKQWPCAYSIATSFTNDDRAKIKRLQVTTTDASRPTLTALIQFANLFCHPRQLRRPSRITEQLQFLQATPAYDELGGRTMLNFGFGYQLRSERANAWGVVLSLEGTWIWRAFAQVPTGTEARRV